MKLSFQRLIIGAVLWSVVMAASATLELYRVGHGNSEKSRTLVAVFALSASLSWLIARSRLALVPPKWVVTQRLAAAVLALGLFTLGITAVMFAVHDMRYLVAWPYDHLSLGVAFEVSFNIAATIYQFLVLGLPLFFPIGLTGLLGASWLFAMKRI